MKLISKAVVNVKNIKKYEEKTSCANRNQCTCNDCDCACA